MESFVRDFVIARVLSFLGGRNNRASSRDVVVATHEEDLTYRARFRPVTIFSSSFAHPCGRSFIRRSTPPSIFCNFYQARFAPPSRPSTPMYFASDPLRNGSGYFVVGHILDAVVNIWGWASTYSTDERMPIFFVIYRKIWREQVGGKLKKIAIARNKRLDRAGRRSKII